MKDVLVSQLCRPTAMVGVSWEHSVDRILFPLLIKADSIIQPTQFLILNLCLKAFSFSIWSFQIIVVFISVPWASLSFLGTRFLLSLHNQICSPAFPSGLDLLISGPLSMFPSLGLCFTNPSCYSRLRCPCVMWTPGRPVLWGSCPLTAPLSSSYSAVCVLSLSRQEDTWV